MTGNQAKDLKKLCEQAPYGKGEKTLVDTSVRRVWRLTPSQFSLRNPDWKRFLQETLSKVQAELGLEKQKLESHLHELLLYETGSFFLPHRDGEKLDRMVATLVIVLPSSYEGGELIVRHEGQEQTIDFSSVENSALQTHFAAFYADCEHEVRPLRKGYRLCLVYNLTLAKSKKSITAPRNWSTSRGSFLCSVNGQRTTQYENWPSRWIINTRRTGLPGTNSKAWIGSRHEFLRKPRGRRTAKPTWHC